MFADIPTVKADLYILLLFLFSYSTLRSVLRFLIIFPLIRIYITSWCLKFFVIRWSSVGYHIFDVKCSFCKVFGLFGHLLSSLLSLIAFPSIFPVPFTSLSILLFFLLSVQLTRIVLLRTPHLETLRKACASLCPTPKYFAFVRPSLSNSYALFLRAQYVFFFVRQCRFRSSNPRFHYIDLYMRCDRLCR